MFLPTWMSLKSQIDSILHCQRLARWFDLQRVITNILSYLLILLDGLRDRVSRCRIRNQDACRIRIRMTVLSPDDADRAYKTSLSLRIRMRQWQKLTRHNPSSFVQVLHVFLSAGSRDLEKNFFHLSCVFYCPSRLVTKYRLKHAY